MSEAYTRAELGFPPRDHDANRAKIPAEQLERCRGMQVAYSWEGDRIVAAAATHEDLFALLQDEGVDVKDVVFDYVEDM